MSPFHRTALLLTLAVLCLLKGTAADPVDAQEKDKSANETATAQLFPNLQPKREKIRYGAYVVPPSSEPDGMKTYLEFNSTLPCRDCTITWIRAGLEYVNGSYANANTSLWLHHIAVLNMNNKDAVCSSSPSVQGERVFASGNERTAADLSKNGTVHAGYYIGANDTFLLIIELMNKASRAQTAMVTLEWDWIPSFPSSFSKIKPLWLDIASCANPEIPITAGASYFKSDNWTADFDGNITAVIGHIHDGGLRLHVLSTNSQTARNDSSSKPAADVACDSEAAYDQSPGYLDPMVSTPGTEPGTSIDISHISSMSTCNDGKVVKGSIWSVEAWYDTRKHAAMMNHNGTLTPVMGIGLVYVAVHSTMEANSSASAAPSSALTSSESMASNPSSIEAPKPTTSNPGTGLGNSELWGVGSGAMLLAVALLV